MASAASVASAAAQADTRRRDQQPVDPREAQKQRYRAYQRAARQSAEAIRCASGIEVQVPEQPEVRMGEDGAFVEATIWIPRAQVG